ncbi:GNAT family N-acetyltransferase [Pseudozobellia sp. WGM2]|uniref:GNAT family N-acetyltransferase n=1 Tax=Pseudozobellia sp. WGM2 TaxID=2787625 RepID=UPI001FD7F7AC|nr:GNAT family N-acetyltransferase [Pseudozobellia sp. WGM2]
MSLHSTLETERLYLRPTEEIDAELIFQLMNTPKFLKFVGDRGISSIKVAKRYIAENMLPQLKNLGYSSYTLITKSENKKIGTCGLYDREGLDGIDIGFGLLPAYEGMGYGYEASRSVLNAAFEIFEIDVISAITSKDNIGSQCLLKKLGLHKIGITKLPQKEEELYLYQIKR